MRDQFIDFDLEGKELQIKTDSAINSNDYLSLSFHNDADVIEGLLTIQFGSTIKYSLGHCLLYGLSITPFTGYYYSFDSTPTTDTEKTWRITEKADHSTLYIHCNDELVLTYVYASSFYLPGCTQFGGADISKIKFYQQSGDPISDNASDSYRIVGKTFSFSLFDLREI